MKTTKLLRLLVISMTILILPACEKDEADSRSSYFKIQGKKYYLETGNLLYYGECGESAYNFDVFLSSGTLCFDTTKEDIIGSGNLAIISMLSAEETFLAEGTYLFDGSLLNNNPFTFWLAIFGAHVDIDEEITGDYIMATDGEVRVGIQESEYFLDFDMNFMEEISISGHFEGKMAVYDCE